MSNFSIFKIGVGPSSSHTLGPLLAANLFCEAISPRLDEINRVCITLHGSLSLTGKGHLSDKAVIWGLNALKAAELDAQIQATALQCAMKGELNLCGRKKIAFDYERDIIFSNDFLPRHENALTCVAYAADGGEIYRQIYYSIGGGFVLSEDEFIARESADSTDSRESTPKNEAIYAKEGEFFALENAKDCLEICAARGWNLAQLSLNYELQFHAKDEILMFCGEIWDAMQAAYYHGIHTKETTLPGSLRLKRRAATLSARMPLTSDDPLAAIDFISLYAIAIAEENASGARVVTAPTNGACAVVPAVMLYLKHHTPNFTHAKAVNFLLVAMLIGSLYKKNASISGAEAGCQAEIGAASSMAAAAMADSLGASAQTACNAAEIAMEHHLGLTCDPVGGLVQIPCIERNAFGAIKAISAARIATSRKSTPKVNLDEIIRAMYETGKDMSAKYRETSLGGLATVVC